MACYLSEECSRGASCCLKKDAPIASWLHALSSLLWRSTAPQAPFRCVSFRQLRTMLQHTLWSAMGQ
jgi:hypothetical protein